MTEQKKTKKYRHYTYFSGDETSTQFACFECRKVFKWRVAFYRGEVESQTCLKCGSKMWFTGTAFKAPRQENVKQWSKAKLLIKNDILFYPDAGYRPKVLREVAPFLKTKVPKTDGEQLLSKIARTKNKKASRHAEQTPSFERTVEAKILYSKSSR
jgi:predicted RNA-binding Zn-ribbon protein involved in translation (DUF1610 family)